MNTSDLVHPSHENLSAFNSGRLAALESAEIERHLAECDECCRLLTTLPSDTLISLLRDSQTDTKAEPSRIVLPVVSDDSASLPLGAEFATLVPGTSKTFTAEKAVSPATADVPAELQNHPRYRIVGLLGRGGMGSVYEAEHRLMNRPVALKVIDKQLVQTPGLVERFQREVQAAARLSHPNIVAAYDAEQAADLHFLVMELVRGQDLSQLLAERGKLPIHEACDYVRQAALGLQHAHERGMVHRDIKPQNLMLAQSSPLAPREEALHLAERDGYINAPEVIKILDFGLAQFASEIAEVSGLTQVGSMMGTPDYMAPEQARDAHSADIRADIYSLGCTLYCLLAGRAPFSQGSILEKILAHVEREPTPLSELRDDVPPELSAVLAKMMAKKPADRFQTPAEVAAALAPFCKPVGWSHAPSELTHSKSKKTEHGSILRTRRPAVLVGLALAAVFLLALLGVIVVATDKGRVEIQSEVDDVEVVVKQGGKEIAIYDVQTGSLVRWFPSGKYDVEIKGDRNDVQIVNGGVTLTRWGKAVVTLKRKAAAAENYALQFDGKENYVDIPSLSWDGKSPLTLEAWLRSDSETANLAIQVRGNARAQIHGFAGVDPGQARWSGLVKTKPEIFTLPSSNMGSLGIWRHVAFVVNGKSWLLFEDGRLAKEFTADRDSYADPVPPGASLGAEFKNGAWTSFFAGALDEVRISRSARYTREKLPVPSDHFTADAETLALYHCDEGRGIVLNDSSGNNHHGKINGARWIAANSPPDSAAKTDWKGWSKDAPPPAIAPFNAEQAKKHQEAWAKHLGVPVEYTNSIGMKFRLIPPGEFLMGSTAEEIAAALPFAGEDKVYQAKLKSEGPTHTVILTQPIYLGVHEVRQQDYESVLGANPSIFSKTGPQEAYRLNFDTSKHPVENISWNDAAEFCVKLSEKEKLRAWYDCSADRVKPLVGTGYRLPTEAEWEFACRAGTTTRSWVGDNDDEMPRAAWIGDSGGRTNAVGQLKPNPFGLYDVYGNVWEWVQDGWSPTYYGLFAEKPAVDPGFPFTDGVQRVIRGGVWPYTASGCRSSHRFAEDASNRRHFFGFRVALPVEAVKQSLDSQAKSDGKGWSNDAPSPAIAPFNAERAKQHQEAWAKHLGVPVEYTNSIGMKFMLIPPGEFTMGSTPAEIEAALKFAGEDKPWRECIKSEAPRHKVILSQPIYLGIQEVTQKDYQALIGTNPSHFTATGPGKEAVAGLDTSTHPVEQVSWNDAAEFCAKLSQKESLKPFNFRADETVTPREGTGYRLPTEAEWELACRAGTTTNYWIGDRDEELARAAWLGTNAGRRTHKVGELKANPLGLYDTHGNVWEWVQDWWEPAYYDQFQEKPAINPSGPSSVASLRVLRGGVWNSDASRCRVTSRYAHAPTDRYPDIGFRVALPVEAVKQAMSTASKGSPTPAVDSFVILSNDAKTERKIATLQAAVAAAQDRDTIEIRGDGPFVTDTVSTDDKALTIRAGKGFKPVLRLSPRTLENDRHLLKATAPLVLEGLDLQTVELPAWDERTPRFFGTILVQNASLHVANCRIAMQREDGVGFGLQSIWTENCSPVEVRNCLLLEDGVLLTPANSPPKGRVEIENCLLKGGTALWATANQLRQVRVGLRNNTFAGWSPCAVHLHPHDPTEGGPCELELTGNLFASTYHFAIGQLVAPDAKPLSAPETEKLLRRAITLKESNSLYSFPPATELMHWAVNNDLATGTQSRKTLAGWEEFWDLKDTGNIQARVRFKNSQALAQKEGLSPDDFRLAKGSPGQGVLPGGKDIGADIDVVGPGAAYEKWQSTPEYQEWLKSAEE